MNFYFIFTKRGLAVILALMILALIILGQFSTVNRRYADGSTHLHRMEYLAGHDIEVFENAVITKESRIPEALNGAAKTYNDIIKVSGFELSDFKGKGVTVYGYTVKSSPEKTVNLIVCDGKIIAGDITDNLTGVISPIFKD